MTDSQDRAIATIDAAIEGLPADDCAIIVAQLLACFLVNHIRSDCRREMIEVLVDYTVLLIERREIHQDQEAA